MIPFSAIAVLLFASVAVAQSSTGQSGEMVDQSLVFVGIGPFGFSGDITVAPGTTVVWINRDTKPHTVTADDGSFDS